MLSALKHAILHSGRRQYDLAAAARISETRLSRLVTGRLEATAEERRRLSLALGESEEVLFPEESSRPKSR